MPSKKRKKASASKRAKKVVGKISSAAKTTAVVATAVSDVADQLSGKSSAKKASGSEPKSAGKRAR